MPSVSCLCPLSVQAWKPVCCQPGLDLPSYQWVSQILPIHKLLQKECPHARRGSKWISLKLLTIFIFLCMSVCAHVGTCMLMPVVARGIFYYCLPRYLLSHWLAKDLPVSVPTELKGFGCGGHMSLTWRWRSKLGSSCLLGRHLSTEPFSWPLVLKPFF